MTKTTSLEISRELYEISGWDDTSKNWGDINPRLEGKHKLGWRLKPNNMTAFLNYREQVPAYECGYLLRKLPDHVLEGTVEHDSLYIFKHKGRYRAGYQNDDVEFTQAEYQDTPEDALALLAIELFKSGVLVKEAA